MRTHIHRIYGWFISIVFDQKRRQRTAEIRHDISMILDPRGCRDADRRYHRCRHYSIHYNIPLCEAGFKGGLDDLRSEAMVSMERARSRRDFMFGSITKAGN